MNLHKTVIVLLALLLAGMAMVPLVSAAEDQKMKELRPIIEENYVSADRAQSQASYALLEFVSTGALGDKSIWIGGKIKPDPLIIYDIDGTRLFYLFTIEKNNGKIGEIKIAASKILGNPVVTIGPGKSSINLNQLEKKSRAEAQKNAKPSTTITTQLVSYAYPNLGMIAYYTDNLTNIQQNVIIDAYDYSIIPEKAPQFEGDQGIVSYYETYPYDKKTEFIESWLKYDQYVTETEKTNLYLTTDMSGEITEKRLQEYTAKLTSLKAASEYRVLSSFPLIGAETTEWCTVGTAKMISQYYGVSRTQTQIATRMGIPVSIPYRGATINEELNYYTGSIASGGLGKTGSRDYYTINWDDSKKEIDENRPFKVGTGIHAKAAIGYIRSPSNGFTYLYFKDPSPLGQGSEYWEWFNELNPQFYNNHIKIN